MDYATILVQLDASRRTHQRLHIAIRLARIFTQRWLDCVYAN